MKKYKKYEIIEDIGSGINFNRKGLRKIIKLGIEGKINKLSDQIHQQVYNQMEFE